MTVKRKVVLVWVALLKVSSSTFGGSYVVDNLDTLADCQRIVMHWKGGHEYRGGSCVQVRRVMP